MRVKSAKGARSRRVRRALLLIPVLIAGAVTLMLLASGSTSVAFTAATSAVAVYLAVEGFIATWTRNTSVSLIKAADDLADLVQVGLNDMAVVRGLNDPRPLAVPRQPAARHLVEDWLDIAAMTGGRSCADPAGWAAGPADLAGSGTDLLRVLDRVPTGRLIVLGESGAGKTMQLLYLVRDLLKRRKASRAQGREDDPVPILVPLASWDPASDQSLHAWIVARLMVDYPALAEPAPSPLAGQTLGQALFTRSLILPVLDGFDEIPEKLRIRALRKINDVLQDGDRLVLSSRTAEYEQAVKPPAKKLLGAAGIHLGALAADEVEDYIRRDTRGDPGWALRWHPVLDALRIADSPVALAFRTPLMVSMACDIYNPDPDQDDARPDPADLCGFATWEEVETHLLRAFIPAAYRPSARRPCIWTAVQAEDYLIRLAQHLEHTLGGAKDLAWWQLTGQITTSPRRLHWSRKALSEKLPAVLVFAGVVTAVFGTLFGLLFGVKYGLLFAPAIGLTCGLCAAVAIAREGAPVDLARATSPRRVLAGDRSTFLRWLLTAPLIGLALGLIVRSAFKPDANMVVAPQVGWLLPAPVIGLLIAGLLKSGTGLIRRLATGLAATATVWLAGWLVNQPMSIAIGHLVRWSTGHDRPGVVAGLLVGLVAGMTMGLFLGYSHSAWGAYTVARCRMALRRRRRLPWRLMRFLSDAHQSREVLRQTGPYYQFRHRRLQEYLAARP